MFKAVIIACTVPMANEKVPPRPQIVGKIVDQIRCQICDQTFDQGR